VTRSILKEIGRKFTPRWERFDAPLRGHAPKGKTPVLALPTRWQKLSMISAVSPRGEVAFRIVEGSINAERFVEFWSPSLSGRPARSFWWSTTCGELW